MSFEDFVPTQEQADYDTTSVGHMVIHQQRQALKYMRLIEHEMPKLVGEHQFRSDVKRVYLSAAP